MYKLAVMVSVILLSLTFTHPACAILVTYGSPAYFSFSFPPDASGPNPPYDGYSLTLDLTGGSSSGSILQTLLATGYQPLEIGPVTYSLGAGYRFLFSLANTFSSPYDTGSFVVEVSAYPEPSIPDNSFNVTSLTLAMHGVGASYTTSITNTNPQPSNPIPEPATLLLLGSGLAGLAGLGRRFKK